MLEILALFAGLSLVQAQPPTVQDLERAEACAFSETRCAPDSTRAAAMSCIRTPSIGGTEAFEACLLSMTDRCYERGRVADRAANDRVILVCSAHSRAAIREAVDAWLIEAETFAPAHAVEQYRALRTQVPARAEGDAAAHGSTPVERAASHEGVWASFARFLWQQRARYP